MVPEPSSAYSYYTLYGVKIFIVISQYWWGVIQGHGSKKVKNLSADEIITCIGEVDFS